ncbi:MAG TPA: transglutaminase domain-containing protein [Candidatus Paceibacterota bacterium]|nr:transglutaminase domain-containing protein [Candidatus Paceibacterota bacterium]
MEPRPGKSLGASPEVKSSKLTREMLFLAEQAAEGKIKVLPGKQWALHYPADQATRTEKLQGLLNGKYKAEEVAQAIKPDALFYNAEDITKDGLEKVSGRIRDLSAFVNNYDYPRFAKFVESMRGQDIPLRDLDSLYSDVTQSRIQKKVMDSYGHTGKKQMEGALRNEAENTIQNIANLSRSEKVLKALKVNWLSEDLGLVSMEERDSVVSLLSGDERKLFVDLKSSYRDYVQKGDESGYKKLTDTIREGLPAIQKKIQGDKPSESMQELQKELEEFQDEAVPPGAPKDPAIPPEDNDEYHTPPPSSGESKEKMQSRPIFEIKPALGGYFASGRKSYYDIESKTWSKRKKLTKYSGSASSGERFTIGGALDNGLKSLPMPNGYALDMSSLKYEGNQPEILRDQNGCFYINAKGPGTFSVDFQKETTLFTGVPVADDLVELYRGSLSSKTEAVLSRLRGDSVHKAEQARQYLLANHFYPGGGDLQAAQALQYKLRSESTGDNYLQNIDVSEYLECYSANTKFIAMMRKAGIPARLVVGHKVEGAEDGKSAITESTGHAWSEIWDGGAWRRFDATPDPKPEDKKKTGEKDKKEDKESAEEAQDGGVDKPGEKEEEKGEDEKEGGKSDKKGEQKGKPESSETKNPLDQMSDATDSEVKQSESELKRAKEQMEKIAQQKKQLDDKLQKTEKFKELSELKKEIGKSELFDDQKKELENKLEAKEEQMKDKIKDELDKMVADGFMDEKRRDEILEELEKKKLGQLDRIQKEVDQENKLYNEYEDIREEIAPLVDRWFKYFAERLPRQKDVGFDEDSLTRQGVFNRRAIMRPRNLLFGMVKNPREMRKSVKPRFMASILVDVSGSMEEQDKLKNARKLLIFYSELFSRISEAFGYIKFSIDIFSDSVTKIKGFDQDYNSPRQYDFENGEQSTIKVRLMKKLVTGGGTNMLDGIKNAANELNKQVEEYPDYASSLYFVGDGGDTNGNAANIAQFLKVNESEHGFGEHMYSAILLGDESERSALATIFGDEHTNVAPDFDDLIEKSMDKFDEDLDEYLRNKTQ